MLNTGERAMSAKLDTMRWQALPQKQAHPMLIRYGVCVRVGPLELVWGGAVCDPRALGSVCVNNGRSQDRRKHMLPAFSTERTYKSDLH